MLVPTRQLAGIESPGISDPDAPNYWEYAWQARTHLDDFLGVELARDEVGLAINSARIRSQDQLHIHIGCIRPDVRVALKEYEANVRSIWSRLPFAIAGQRYKIMRINADELDANPFQLVVDGISTARNDIASHTIVVAGARYRDGTNGFYVLTERSDTDARARGGELLDYDCSVLHARR